MIPPGVGLDDLVTWGIVALFGGAILDAGIGALVGRRHGFEAGAGTAMVLFGLTGLGAAAWVAWYLFVASTLVTLPRSGCEPLAAEDGVPRSSDVYLLARSGMAPLRLSTAALPRICPEDETPPARLRVRRAAIADAETTHAAAEIEDDPRRPVMLLGVFGAFGGFGVLGGIVLLASGAADRRRARGVPDRPPPVVHPLTRTAAGIVRLAGTLVLVAAIAAAGVAEDPARSVHLAFDGLALACAFWLVAQALQRRLDLATAATLLMLGGGFALAAAAVRFMA